MNKNSKEYYFIDQNNKLPSNKGFGITFSIIFLIIFAFTFYFSKSFEESIIFLVFSIIFIILSLTKPNCFYLLNKAWSKFGFFLSRIFNTVFIFLCYILIILPTSLYMRLFFNYDSMNLKKKTSLWFHRNNDSDTDNLKDQF